MLADLELIFGPLVDETDITAKNLSGEVALNGTVPSYPQYLEAAACEVPKLAHSI